MNFILTKAKLMIRNKYHNARYQLVKVANKLTANGMGRKMAAHYSAEFTKMPEIVQVVRS